MRTQLVFAAVLLLGVGTTGCFDGYSDSQVYYQGTGGSSGTGGSTGGGGTGGTGGTTMTTPPECIPSSENMTIENGCGIFVSESKGNDATGKGTKEAPLKTLPKGIELAAKTSERVYMCGETFTGPIQVGASAKIYGALDCATDWKYLGDAGRTLITAKADEVPLRIQGAATVDMQDINVKALPAEKEGGSSVAVVAEMGTTLNLSNCAVEAGSGHRGADGVPFPVSAADGGDGTAGTVACFADVVMTGAAPTNECGEVDSVGGAGGLGTEATGNAGNSGQPFIETNGGAGDDSGQCKPGTKTVTPSASGDPGAGAPAGVVGSLTVDGFSGVPGSDGTPGKPGQGGGGGGGSKGGSLAGQCPNAASDGGASGGSGGAGGCGGLGGKGGQPAGASIAIVSLIDANLSFAGVTLTVGDGGAGGDGGSGQPGGAGGKGGSGGGAVGTLKPGCMGGAGADGGAGGIGGGGLGGHSIGIAYKGTKPPAVTGVTITLGKAGSGGLGADAMHAGAAGVAKDVQGF